MARVTNKLQVLLMPVEHGPSGNTGLWPYPYFLWQSAKDAKNKGIRRNCRYGLKESRWLWKLPVPLWNHSTPFPYCVLLKIRKFCRGCRVCVCGGGVSTHLETHISKDGLSFQDNLAHKYSFEILRYFNIAKPNLYFCSFYHCFHNESVFHKAQRRITEHFPMNLASWKGIVFIS